MKARRHKIARQGKIALRPHRALWLVFLFVAGCLWASVTSSFAATTLNIAYTNGQVVLSWQGAGFALQSAQNLNSPVPWSPAGLPIVINGTNHSTMTQPSSAAVFYRLISGLPAPAGGLLVVPEETAFFVDWDLVPAATNYNLYLATAPGVAPTNYSTLPGGQKISGVNPPYFVAGLTNGVRYYVVVAVTNGTGESLPYAEASAVFGPHAAVSGSIFMDIGTGGGQTNSVFIPGAQVWLMDSNGVTTAAMPTDLNGGFSVPAQPAGVYTICYALSNSLASCGTICSTQQLTLGSEDITLDPFTFTSVCAVVYGRVMMDGSFAFQDSDSFMGFDIKAQVTFVNGAGQTNTVPVNHVGEFVFAGAPPGSYVVRIDCEGSHVEQSVVLPTTNALFLLLPSHVPVIHGAFVQDSVTGKEIFRAAPGATVRLVIDATDPDGDALTYDWIPGLGNNNVQPANSANVLWQLPNSGGVHIMYFVVRDHKGGVQTGKLFVNTDPDVLFTGTITQNGATPTNAVQVTINQQTVSANSGGYFVLKLTNPIPPYVMTIQSPGWEFFSKIFWDQAVLGLYSLHNSYEETIYSSAPFIFNGPITLGFPTGTIVNDLGQTYFGAVIVTYSIIDPSDPAGRLPGLGATAGGTNYVLTPLLGASIALRTQTGEPLFINPAHPEKAFVSAPLGAIRPVTNTPVAVWLYNPTNGFYTAITNLGSATTNAVSWPILKTGVSVCALSNVQNACVTLEIGKSINLPVDVTIFSPAAQVKTITKQFTVLSDLPPNQLIVFKILSQVNEIVLSNGCVISNSITTGAAGSACITNKLNFPGLPTPEDMLSFRSESDTNYGNAYYKAIDPFDSKLTFGAWKSANGFNVGTNIEAIYFNNGDLGFGRWMGMHEKPNGDIAYFVSNYGNSDAAIQARAGSQTNGLLATVCMEYSAHPKFPDVRYTKFYIFNEQNARVNGADLDGGGVKFVPHLCVVCHGGRAPSQDELSKGDVNSKFIPFDLESFRYSSDSAFSQSNQAPAFKQLSGATLRTGPSASITELVQGWYGGAGLPGNYNKDFIAAGWNNSGVQQELYSKVFKVSCRSCHSTRNNFPFANFTDLKAKRISDQMCGGGATMPNALRTFNIFWSSRCSAVSQPTLLKNAVNVDCLQ